MSLRLSGEDFSWSRSRKALPVFLLLWVGGILLALSYLFGTKSFLQDIERREVVKILDSYFSGHQFSTGLAGSFQLHFDYYLQGLYFLRIIQGNEQLLVVNENVDQSGFKALADLDPGSTGAWIALESDGGPQLLTIVVRKFQNGVTIQAGKSSSEARGLYGDLVKRTVLSLLLSVFFLWPLSLLFVRYSLSPLISIREKIAELLEKPGAVLLPESGQGPELNGMCVRINSLIRQNRQLVAEMQQSLDNVAHDLRTPMTRLRSVAEYALQAEGDSSNLREALSDCLEESERVLAMLRIMMSVAEAESGTMRLELQDCNVEESISQVISLYEYVAEEKNIQLELVDHDELWIRADATRISQVWANLLDNAIKYTNSDGWVKIGYRQEKPGEVAIFFEDNGIGISENEKPRIWERLYRGDRSRTQKGLGLGLNYVQAVVLAHGGSIVVDSRLHKGSVFTVRLPSVR
jgi:signal transduction histidine kinase